MTETWQPAPPDSNREQSIDVLLADFERLWRRLAGTQSTDFVGVDVTMAQAKVLHLACIHPGSTMSWIAQQLHVTLPTVSGLVDRLVDHGLLERRDDPADRRQVIVDLTDDGWSMISRFRDSGLGSLRTLLERLPPSDLDHLRLGVAALADTAEAAAHDPSSVDERKPR
jgi:DNA-binding MarR family transcriptional regulator